MLPASQVLRQGSSVPSNSKAGLAMVLDPERRLRDPTLLRVTADTGPFEQRSHALATL